MLPRRFLDLVRVSHGHVRFIGRLPVLETRAREATSSKPDLLIMDKVSHLSRTYGAFVQIPSDPENGPARDPFTSQPLSSPPLPPLSLSLLFFFFLTLTFVGKDKTLG